MTEEAKKDACCSDTSSKNCCHGKKAIVGILLGLLLFSLGFFMGKSNVCPWQVCPISQHK